MTSSYERKFVFLAPEDKGYEGTIGKLPKGHIEIEVKDQRVGFKVFAENLKEMGYQVLLLTLEGRAALIGNVYVPANGKCQEEFKGNRNDVMNSGLSWEQFQAIAICPQGKLDRIALSGWLRGKKGMIPLPIIEKADFEKEEPRMDKQKEEWAQPVEQPAEEIKIPMGFKAEPEAIEQPLQEEKEEEPAPEERGKELEVESDGQLEEENIPKEQELSTEELYKEKYQDLEKELSEEYWVDFGADYPEERVFQEGEDNIDLSSPYYYINENVKELKEVVQEVDPFQPPMANHTWWRINREEKELERFYLYYNGSFVHLTYPYMEYKNFGENYVQEYEEMIFGIVYQEKASKNRPRFYVYGIPGRFCIQEQPYQGTTGFLYWHPLKDHRREKGAMGYWLLYIDAQTGAVAVPKRPTIPPVCRE